MKVYVLFKWVSDPSMNFIDEICEVTTSSVVAMWWLDQDNNNDYYERILDGVMN